ncbi:hypothetical protein BM613_08365 [Sulfoacidibacillus thermotolerans]|uniref:Flagellar protein n=1 Tax=Sulfoacidibacillus thermotolerans TaxID=1765684 RepID=A0A2U3D872_SULT2|nr:hypothetical protein BM613_08365 [Sulfoacidibacillus thermotolerans]
MLKHCRKCGGLFSSSDPHLCPLCLEEAQHTVKQYLEVHRGANVLSLVRDTGLSLAVVNRILANGSIYAMPKQGPSHKD